MRWRRSTKTCGRCLRGWVVTDTDAMVRLMQHVADLADGALELQARLAPIAGGEREAQVRTVAALAACGTTLRVVAASVAPPPDPLNALLVGEPMEPESVRRELAYAERDDVIAGSGEPVEPKVLGQILSVRFSADAAEALRDHAELVGLSASDVIRGAVADLLRRYKTKEAASG